MFDCPFSVSQRISSVHDECPEARGENHRNIFVKKMTILIALQVELSETRRGGRRVEPVPGGFVPVLMVASGRGGAGVGGKKT